MRPPLPACRSSGAITEKSGRRRYREIRGEGASGTRGLVLGSRKRTEHISARGLSQPRNPGQQGERQNNRHSRLPGRALNRSATWHNARRNGKHNFMSRDAATSRRGGGLCSGLLYPMVLVTIRRIASPRTRQVAASTSRDRDNRSISHDQRSTSHDQRRVGPTGILSHQQRISLFYKIKPPSHAAGARARSWRLARCGRRSPAPPRPAGP